MYRIYINEAVLIIAKSAPASIKDYKQIEIANFNMLDFYNNVTFECASGNYFIITNNIKRMFQKIKKMLKNIQAAGGLVRNEKNEYLFIFRKGKWDLPKGKIDKGEKTKLAACREVEEECGIKVKTAELTICKTYHIYKIQEELILKKTTWYAIKAINQSRLTPQLEEDITEARWIAPQDFNLVKQNTYQAIKEVLHCSKIIESM